MYTRTTMMPVLSLLQAKCVSIAILFVVALLSGLIPLVLYLILERAASPSKRQQRYLNYVTCFSGGVFFASAILVLLPEAREAAEQYLEEVGYETPFPVTECLAGIGFFLILVSEQVGSGLSRHLHKRNSDKVTTKPSATLDGLNIVTNTTDVETVVSQDERKTISPSLGPEGEGKTDPKSDAAISEDVHRCVDVSTTEQPATGTDTAKTEDPELPSDNASINDGSLTKDDAVLSNKSGTEKKEENEEEENEEEDADEEPEIPKFSTIRTFILAIALSLHLVFDGIALGLLTTQSAVWGLLVALVVHKIVVCFSVGMFLRDIYEKKRYIIGIIAAFSAVSPCGVAIGIAIRSQSDNHVKDILSAILQGLASGTFLYVTFFEILQKEFKAHSTNIRRTLACLTGFVAVAVIQFVVKE